jgi:hypothetical protein
VFVLSSGQLGPHEVIDGESDALDLTSDWSIPNDALDPSSFES